jgi:rhomboid family GlyGly-CTERM serine protease
MTGNDLRSMFALLKSIRLTVTLVTVAVILAVCPAVSRCLEYDRVLVCSGQIWRIFTCHLTHCNLDHLLWDALALGILGAMCERRSRMQYLLCLLVCSAAISAAILAWQPEMFRYRGLSGLDTGLFALLAVGLLNEKRREHDAMGLTVICLFILGLAGKIAFELATGSTVFVDHAAAGFEPAPLAHLVGLVVGAALGLTGCREMHVYEKRHLASA